MPRRASVSPPTATTTPSARAGRDRGALVQHARSLGDRRGIGGRGILDDRQRLARETRLVDLEVVGGDQAAVRGHDLAGLELEDVARDELVGGQAIPAAGPEHADDRALASLERGDRELGLVALDAADRGVDGEHGGDQGGVEERAGHGGQGRPGDEDRRQRVDDLLGDGGRELARARGDPGRALAAVGGELRGEAGVGAAVEAREHGVAVEAVPRGRVGDRRGWPSRERGGLAQAVGEGDHRGRVGRQHHLLRLGLAQAAERERGAERRADAREHDALLGDLAGHRAGVDEEDGVAQVLAEQEVCAPRRPLRIEGEADAHVGAGQRRQRRAGDDGDHTAVALQIVTASASSAEGHDVVGAQETREPGVVGGEHEVEARTADAGSSASAPRRSARSQEDQRRDLAGAREHDAVAAPGGGGGPQRRAGRRARAPRGSEATSPRGHVRRTRWRRRTAGRRGRPPARGRRRGRADGRDRLLAGEQHVGRDGDGVDAVEQAQRRGAQHEAPRRPRVTISSAAKSVRP
jgi:hypothetical protein